VIVERWHALRVEVRFSGTDFLRRRRIQRRKQIANSVKGKRLIVVAGPSSKNTLIHVKEGLDSSLRSCRALGELRLSPSIKYEL
jgi:hypothetical protein